MRTLVRLWKGEEHRDTQTGVVAEISLRGARLLARLRNGVWQLTGLGNGVW